MRSQCYLKRILRGWEAKAQIKELSCSAYYNSYASKGEVSISKTLPLRLRRIFLEKSMFFKDSKLICYFEVDAFDKNKSYRLR